MNKNLYENQVTKRTEYLNLLLSSDHPRKLIIAGPGTGKTYSFGEVIRENQSTDNLALTFIRKLVFDMDREFGDSAEVKTFHAYCKKLLHKKIGGVELVPFLTKIIESDATLLNLTYSNFDSKIQLLDEDSFEVDFYLDRGDYYEAVSFNDSVFRLYKYVRNGEFELPKYNQIVVDEYQDFNPLEVAFIKELARNNPILIVGDDDQAVYSARNSSPNHLRNLHNSGEYKLFSLPFCSRCPRVIVEATNDFVQTVIAEGGFKSRIERLLIPFLEDKEYENTNYPKIVTACTSNIASLTKFLQFEINKIPEDDINESHKDGYPCVLIVGKRQYLNPIHKRLREHFSNVTFTQAQRLDYSIIDGFDLLIKNKNSNLGWRILAEFEFDNLQMKDFIEATIEHTPMIALLPHAFIEKQKKVIDVLRSEKNTCKERLELEELIGNHAECVFDYFLIEKEEDQQEIDESKPTILLSSFEGCKGLSAGHVFIVGLNNGIIPKISDDKKIDDIEFCKFIVALSRTRKKCYLLSNRWDYAPQGNRNWPSPFISQIPNKHLKDLGYLKSKNITH